MSDKILFLYAYRDADRLKSLISDTLTKIQSSTYFDCEDITRKTRSEVMEVILSKRPKRLILNGHGSGVLSFFTGKDKFNFQEMIKNDETP